MMSRGAKAWQGVAIIVLAASCAKPGPEQLLERVEADTEAWASVTSGVEAEAVTLNWLADLHDPVVSDLVFQAVSSNYQLRASARRVEAARERARIARADLLPSLGASLSGDRSVTQGGAFLGGVFLPGAGAEDYSTTYSLGFSLNWELDIWGRLTDQTRASYLDAAAAHLDLAAAQLSVAGSAAQSHYALTAARLQRQLAERDVETGQANLRIIERRYNRGISTSLDLRLARSSLASSEAALQSRLQQELETARRLEVLLGEYPAANILAAATLPDLKPLLRDDYQPLGTPEELLLRRPDVISAENRLRAGGLRVSAARKAFLPSLSLRGTYTERAFTLNDSGGATREPDLSDVFDFDNLFKQLVANASQPLFQGGRLVANERAAQDEAKALLYDYANTALNAWREVEDAVAAERFLAARAEALQIAYAEAAAAADLTERRYLAGTTSIFDLINAQQRRIAAEGQLIDAKRARLSNRVDLYLALGAPYQFDGEEQLADVAADGENGRPQTGDIL